MLRKRMASLYMEKGIGQTTAAHHFHTFLFNKISCTRQRAHANRKPINDSRSVFSTIFSKRDFSTGKIDPVPIDSIRNVAIIAHVDRGKTTLVDSIMRFSGVAIADSRLLDQGELEKEKGITILAKTTRIMYKNHILNVRMRLLVKSTFTF